MFRALERFIHFLLKYYEEVIQKNRFPNRHFLFSYIIRRKLHNGRFLQGSTAIIITYSKVMQYGQCTIWMNVMYNVLEKLY